VQQLSRSVIIEFCEAFVRAPVEVVADMSRGHGETVVFEVSDGDGARFYVKHYRTEAKWTAETLAYERWVPSLGSHAPDVVASFASEKLLLLTMAPGTLATHVPNDLLQTVHRRAGSLLRRFHESESMAPFDNFASWKLQEFREWRPTAAGILGGEELAFVESQIRLLTQLPVPKRSPCHLDYTPQNWIVNDFGLHIIDFADSAPEAWLTDLVRLSFGPWRGTPHLRKSFMAGYGIELTGSDRLAIGSLGALANARTIVWAYRHDDIASGEAARVALRSLMNNA
jgi:Ser/Thr protein kinase RdoA (MazF antagonist)